MSIFAEPEADTAPAGDQPMAAEGAAEPTADAVAERDITAEGPTADEPTAHEPTAEAVAEPVAESIAETDVVAEPVSDSAGQVDAVAQAETDVVSQTDAQPAAEAVAESAPRDEFHLPDRTGWYDTTTRPSDNGWDVGQPAAASEPEPAVAEPEPAPLAVSSEDASAPGQDGTAPGQDGSPEPETHPTPVIASLPRPIGVMDPDATADRGWPAPEPQPVAVTPTVDHTSAAVRLLRSVAPWTAPTQGNDRSPDED
jgi:hypothetical protein